MGHFIFQIWTVLMVGTISYEQSDKFEYECDVLGRLNNLENELKDARNEIAVLGAKLKEALNESKAQNVSVTCSSPWFAFGQSCLLFGTELLTFLDAQDFCQSEGAHLVHVYSALQNEFLRKIAKANQANYWIGLNDLVKEGVWRWYGKDTTVNFTDWAPGQPDDGSGGEDCAQFLSTMNYHWNDIECYHVYKPICEK